MNGKFVILDVGIKAYEACLRKISVLRCIYILTIITPMYNI